MNTTDILQPVQVKHRRSSICATFPHFVAACPRTLCQHVASPPWQHETILRTTVRSEKSKAVSAASSEHLMEASLAHPFFVRKQLKE